MALDFYQQLANQRQRRDQILQNNARAANFSATYVSNGDGDVVITKVLEFDVVFCERPMVTTGVVITHAPDPSQFALPRAQIGVYRWETHKSPAGLLYTGAYLFATVDIFDKTGTVVALNGSPCVLEHHIRFDGIALKKLPDSILSVDL